MFWNNTLPSVHSTGRCILRYLVNLIRGFLCLLSVVSFIPLIVRTIFVYWWVCDNRSIHPYEIGEFLSISLRLPFPFFYTFYFILVDSNWSNFFSAIFFLSFFPLVGKNRFSLIEKGSLWTVYTVTLPPLPPLPSSFLFEQQWEREELLCIAVSIFFCRLFLCLRLPPFPFSHSINSLFTL